MPTVGTLLCGCGRLHRDGPIDLPLCKHCGATTKAHGRKFCSPQCRSFKHGHGTQGGSRTYRSWHAMRQRCLNANDSAFYHYGARGVTVCERWNSFETFLADMGECPPGLTLDRIDSAGHYTPDNCRWASRWQQAQNLQANRRITWNGETRTIGEWAVHLGMNRKLLETRIDRGWDIGRALTAPPVFIRKRAS